MSGSNQVTAIEFESTAMALRFVGGVAGTTNNDDHIYQFLL